MRYLITIILSDLDEIHVRAEASSEASAFALVKANPEFRAFLGSRDIQSYTIVEDRTPDEKVTPYELLEDSGRVMIRRNKPPRFIGVVTMGVQSDIEEVEWLDTCTALQAASAMRKAGEFLRKKSWKKFK